MALSTYTPEVLAYLGYSKRAGDFYTESRPSGLTLVWLHTDPEPSEQTINDTALGAPFLTWLAEHGGDVVLTRHRRAREAFASNEAANVAQLAALMEISTYAITTANKFNALLDAIANASSLAGLKTAAGAISSQPIPTWQQVRDAIIARIDAGDGDS